MTRSLFAFAFVILAACGSSTEAPDAPVVEKVRSLAIVPPADTVYVGALDYFTADYRVDGIKTPPPSAIAWSVSSSTIATADPAGSFYARAAGEVTVTATAGDVTVSAKVVVKEPGITEGSVALPSSPVADVAYDGRRNLLYLSLPDNRVGVLSLASLSFDSPILLSSRPAGLDVSNRDFLLVALPNESAIGEVSLGTRFLNPLYTLREGFGPRTTAALRVTADNHALVAITAPGTPGFGLRLVDIDLATHAEINRPDFFDISGVLRLARSADAQRVAMRVDEVFPAPGYVFDVSTKLMGARRTIPGLGDAALSMSADGSRILSWRVRHSNALVALDSATASAYTGGPSAISPDGTLGFFTVGNSVVGVSFSTNSVVRTFDYPSPPQRIYALPGGTAIIVITAASVFVNAL